MSKKGSKKKKLVKYFEAQALAQEKARRRKRDYYKPRNPPPLWASNSKIF